MHINIRTIIGAGLLAGTATMVATAAAAPVRKAHAKVQDPQDQPGDVLFYKLGPKAPFARVEIDNLPESCGRLGCQIAITGVSRTGKKTDLTFTEFLTNATIGSYAEIFGRVDATGMPYIVLEQGLINGGSSFNLFAYKPDLRRYAFVKHVSGYAAGKKPVADNPTRIAPALVAAPVILPPALPPSVEYISYTGSERFPVFNDFTVTSSGGTLGGSGFMQIGIFSGAAPLTGTYANGECSVIRKKQTWRGPCDGNEFSGFVYDSKGKQGEPFRFRTEAYLARLKANRGAAPVAVAAAPPARRAVWSLGRARFLVEPRGGCPPEIALGTRSYCFTQAINWLRRHPDKQDVDVVAMETAWLPGSLVPHNNGQGWDIYRVARQGNGFSVGIQRHYYTQVRIPQGCIVEASGQQGWYIGFDHNGKVAIEAGSYLCANGWAGQPLYAAYLNTQDIDAAPGEIQLPPSPAQGNGTDVPPRPATGQDRLAGTRAGSTGQPDTRPAADWGGPQFRDRWLADSSANISGEPQTDAAPKPKPKRKR